LSSKARELLLRLLCPLGLSFLQLLKFLMP